MHCKNIKDLSSHRHQGQCIPNRGIGITSLDAYFLKTHMIKRWLPMMLLDFAEMSLDFNATKLHKTLWYYLFPSILDSRSIIVH